jgi:hypothetical protein
MWNRKISDKELQSCARRLDDEFLACVTQSDKDELHSGTAHLPIEIDSDDEDPEKSRPLNDIRRSKQRPHISNYEAVGTTTPFPSKTMDKENSSSERKKMSNAGASSKPAAEKKNSEKRAAAPDPLSCTSKKKKRTKSLWQRLDGIRRPKQPPHIPNYEAVGGTLLAACSTQLSVTNRVSGTTKL